MFSAEDQSTGLVYKIGLHIRPVSTPDWSGRSDRSQDQIDPNTRLVSTPNRSTDQTSLVDQTGVHISPVSTADWSGRLDRSQDQIGLVDQTDLVLRPVW